ETVQTPWVLSGIRCQRSSSHRVMKSGLTNASFVSGLPPTFVPKWAQIFDFGGLPAYNAALSSKTVADESRKSTHGRPFPVQEHHAPQGAPGRPEVEIVQQVGAGNYGGGEAWDSGSGDEPSASCGRYRCAPGEHAEGQY